MTDIDKFINDCPKDIQDRLKEVRDIIREVIPENTTEKISWGMPTFYLNGNLVHFFPHKNHLGFYPGASGIDNFKDKFTKYSYSKGAVQFMHAEELPKKLIQDIVEFRVKENMEKGESK